MAEAKSVDLNLNIIAHLKGVEGAFNKLTGLMGGVARQAKSLTLGFGKMVGAGAALALGFKAFEGVGKFMAGAVAEAKAAQKAEDKLSLALQRNAKLQKIEAIKPGTIKGQQEELNALANDLEKTGVVAATSMKTGFAGLGQAGFGPKKIAEMSKGFEGTVIALKGVGASADEVENVTGQLRGFIKSGMLSKKSPLAKLFSAEELAKVKKMKSETARAALAYDVIRRQEGRVDQALTTHAGKVFVAEQAYRRLQETIGKPLLESQLAWKQVLNATALAIEPIAERIANTLTPAIKSFSNWLVEQTPIIRAWGKNLEEGFVAAKGAFAVLGDWAGMAWEDVMDSMAEGAGKLNAILIEPVKKALAPVWEPLVAGANEIWSKVQGPLEGSMKGIKAYIKGQITFDDLKAILKTNWQLMWMGLGKIDFQKMYDDVKAGFDKIDWGGIFTAAGNTAKLSWDNAWTWLGNVGDWFNEQIAKINWDVVGETITDGIIGMLTGAQEGEFPEFDLSKAFDIIKGFDEAATKIVEGLGKGIEKSLSKINWGELLQKEWDQTVIDFSKLGQKIGIALKRAFELAIKFAMGPLGEFFDRIDKMTGGPEARKAAMEAHVETTAIGTERVKGGVAVKGGETKGFPTTTPEAVEGAEKLVKATEKLPDEKKVAIATTGAEQANQDITTLNTNLEQTPADKAIQISLLGVEDSIRKLNELKAAIDATQGGVSAALAPRPAPGMQAGGIVAARGMYNLAERGAEMVVPLQGGGEGRSRGLLSQAANLLGMRGGLGGGGGPISLSMSVPITISNVPVGQEGAIGREIEAALQDPVRQLLEQLRKAKDEEQRLSYV